MGRFDAYNTSDVHTGNTPLAANAEVIIGPFQTDVAQAIAGSVKADVGGDLYIEQSFDGGTHFDIAAHYAVSGGSGEGFQEPVLAPIAQVRYVNGGVDQTYMRLFCRTFAQGR